MGVYHFKEVTGRTGSVDFDTRLEYTRVFQALTDSPLDGASVVRAHPGIPAFGDVYQYTAPGGATVTDPKARCVFVRVTQDDPECFTNWTVTADYRGIDDPTAQPPEVKWGTVPFQVAKLKDAASPPLVYKNSAGDPFESGRLIDDYRFSLTVVRNVPASAFDPIQAELYKHSLNEQVFLAARHPPGLAPRTCKLLLTADLVWYDGSRTEFYWRRTAAIEYRRDTWDGKLRDQGYREIIPGKFGDKPQPAIDENGGRPTHPVLLNGSGARLPVGDPPVELSFTDYVARNWGGLDLEY